MSTRGSVRANPLTRVSATLSPECQQPSHQRLSRECYRSLTPCFGNGLVGKRRAIIFRRRTRAQRGRPPAGRARLLDRPLCKSAIRLSDGPSRFDLRFRFPHNDSMNEDLRELRDSLSAFDAVDIAAGIGALQLLPVNAERQLRFERAAALAHSVVHAEGRPRISSGRWRSLFSNPPIASSRLLSSEDPAEQLFTESVSFDGGSYVVFCGIAERSADIVRLLLRAVFLSPDEMPPDYVQELRALAYAALRLGDAIADRIGVHRNLPPEPDPDGRVVVPPSGQFSRLKEAVIFSTDELASVVHPVPLATLDPFVSTLGDADLDPDDESDRSYPYLKPILRTGDTFVVVMPPGLLVALQA